MADRLHELLRFVAQSLVDRPDEVQVDEEVEDNARLLELRVSPGEIGKVIGRGGATARAIRQLVTAASAGGGQRVLVDIVEEE